MRKIPSTVGEYIAVAKRRWLLFLFPFLVVPILVFFVGRKLPRTYRSTSTVLILAQGVPKGLVDDTMQNDVKDRFESISNVILSQSRLTAIVDQLGLYKLSGVSSREEAVAKLRKDMTIEMVTEHTDRAGSAVFKISYLASTAQQAQDVTREVVNLSINGNLESREQQAVGNMTFIQKELDRAQADLRDKEQRLNAFRARHGELEPGQASAAAQMLGSYQTANAAAMERVDQQRASIQAIVDSETASHAASSASSSASAPVEISDPQITAKREELRVATQRYTDKHPDVLRLQNELNALLHRPRAFTASGVPITASTAAQQRLQSSLITATAELRVREQRQAEIERSARAASGRTQVSPVVAGEALQLQSSYDAAQKYYASLADKQHTSELTANLEKTRGHDLVQVLDAANLPRHPDSPNLRMIYLAGIGLGLVFGLVLALGVELLDQTFHDQNDLAAYLEVPMIAIIPTLYQ